MAAKSAAWNGTNTSSPASGPSVISTSSMVVVIKGAWSQWVRVPPGKGRSSRWQSERRWRQRSSRSFRCKRVRRDSASAQAVTRGERRAGLEKGNAEADPPEIRGRSPPLGKESDMRTQRFRRGGGDGMCVEGSCATREAPRGGWRGGAGQRSCREARNRPLGVADRVVVPVKPGNAGGGKDPWSGNGAGGSERQARSPPRDVR